MRKRISGQGEQVEWLNEKFKEDKNMKEIQEHEVVEHRDYTETLDGLDKYEDKLMNSKQGDNLVANLEVEVITPSSNVICDVCGMKNEHSTVNCPVGDRRALATAPCFSAMRLAYYPKIAHLCLIELSKKDGYLNKYPNLQYQLLADIQKQCTAIEERKNSMRNTGGYNNQGTSYNNQKYGPNPGTYSDMSRNAVIA